MTRDQYVALLVVMYTVSFTTVGAVWKLSSDAGADEARYRKIAARMSLLCPFPPLLFFYLLILLQNWLWRIAFPDEEK